jgi:hypothetical protein
MPDDKQDLHQEDFSLDDILREVSSWSEPEETDETPSDVASPQTSEAVLLQGNGSTAPPVEEDGVSVQQEAHAEPTTVPLSPSKASSPTPEPPSAPVSAAPKVDPSQEQETDAAPEVNPSQEQETDAAQEAEASASSEAAEETQAEEEASAPPDNLIPLYPEQESKIPEKEPETIR